MDSTQPDEPNPKPKPKPSLFLGCFGFPRKHQNSQKKSSKSNRRRWSTSLFKHYSATKTVPVDATVGPDKVQSKKKTAATDTLKKLKQKGNNNSFDEIPSKRLNPATHNKITTPLPVVTTTSTQLSEERLQLQESSEEKIIQENEKITLDGVVGSPNQSYCQRKKDARKNGSSPPGSPEGKTKSTIDRSTSLLAPTPAGKSRVSKKAGKENGRKLEAVIGMSIVMVTLIIMLLWGRLCAILCTCAWLYFVPRLREGEILKQYGDVLGEPDLNSEEYKKKVVFEGFLERSHRSKSSM